MAQGRALGLGLMGLGAVLGGLVVLWLLATAASGDLRAGGFVLGLILAAVLGLPPIGVGYYMLQREKQQGIEELAWAGRQRVLDQDRLFRARIASEARQQAARLRRAGADDPMLERAAVRLGEIGDQLEGSDYDRAAWYDAVKLTDEDLDALARYDRLVSDGLRRIGRQVDRLELGAAESGENILRDVQSWEAELDQRLELLRGERAPSVPPTALLEAREPARGAAALSAMARGDAVTIDERDYVVAVSVSYFAGGQGWKLHRLDAEEDRRWLYVGPGALEVAVMEETAPKVEGRPPEIEHGELRLRLRTEGTANASVDSGAGAESASVEYGHYAAEGGERYWLERWPDGSRAYVGSLVRPQALEVWPAERAPSGG
jgi:hypothetical protein